MTFIALAMAQNVPGLLRNSPVTVIDHTGQLPSNSAGTRCQAILRAPFSLNLAHLLAHQGMDVV